MDECSDMRAKMKAGERLKGQLRKVASAMGLQSGQYDLRFNPGGPAVSGEATLHTDKIYIQASHDSELGVLIRSCKGRKDYTGGPNQWFPFALLERPEELAAMIKTLRI